MRRVARKLAQLRRGVKHSKTLRKIGERGNVYLSKTSVKGVYRLTEIETHVIFSQFMHLSSRQDRKIPLANP